MKNLVAGPDSAHLLAFSMLASAIARYDRPGDLLLRLRRICVA